MRQILSFDLQLIVNAVFLALNVFLLNVILSYYLFDPVRNYMKKRTERIAKDLETASQEKQNALDLKQNYEVKINDINKESDVILSKARKKAMIREDEIISAAKEDANRILENAKIEINREKEKVKDEVKNEVIAIASQMAEKFVSASLDKKLQNQLIEETLNEMGEKTWLN